MTTGEGAMAGVEVGRRLAWAAGFASAADERPLSAEEVRIAVREGLGALLGHRLHGGTATVEREEDRALLRRRLLAGVVQEITQGAVLAEVAGRFAERDLPFLRMKAAALRGRVLPEGTRPATDLDFLVTPARFAEAVAVLRGAGFTLCGAPRRALTVSRYHERALHRGEVAVDLHRALSAWPLFAAKPEELLAEATAAPDGGLVPTPEVLLVTLAAHAAQHGFQVPFRSIVDALAVVRGLRPEAGRVVELARRWRVARGTAMLLACARAVGLEGEEWGAAMQELGGGLPLAVWVEDLLLRPAGDGDRRLGRERWWRTRLVDRRWRTGAFYAYRVMLLAGDVVLRVAPRRWRERIEGVHGSG